MTKKSPKSRVSPKIILEIHSAMLDISGVINSPQQDEAIVKSSNVKLDRALFPLLMRIKNSGPIGVVDLADRVGRDYTTVSRQVAKLAQLGLIDRGPNAGDRRVREAVVSSAGREITDQIEATRVRLSRDFFASWEACDIKELARLSRKLANTLVGES